MTLIITDLIFCLLAWLNAMCQTRERGTSELTVRWSSHALPVYQAGKQLHYEATYQRGTPHYTVSKSEKQTFPWAYKRRCLTARGQQTPLLSGFTLLGVLDTSILNSYWSVNCWGMISKANEVVPESEKQESGPNEHINLNLYTKTVKYVLSYRKLVTIWNS